MKIVKIFFLLFFIGAAVNAQDNNFQLGVDGNMRFNQQSGYFNFSDPEAINIKVAVWGWVKYPGKYTIPSYSTVSDLLSFAGGPSDATNLEDLRIYRTGSDSSHSLIVFSYGDVFQETKSIGKGGRVPKLEAGDILVVPGEPRIYTREKVSMWTSILSGLISLTILVINIVK